MSAPIEAKFYNIGWGRGQGYFAVIKILLSEGTALKKRKLLQNKWYYSVIIITQTDFSAYYNRFICFQGGKFHPAPRPKTYERQY